MTKNNTKEILVDAELYEYAEGLFKELGIDMTNAVNLYLAACLREGGIPLNLSLVDDCGCGCDCDCGCDCECDCDCDCEDECNCGCGCEDECNCDEDCECGCNCKEEK